MPEAPDLPAEVEHLLADYRGGDEDAFERLFSLLYADLRRIAHSHLRAERAPLFWLITPGAGAVRSAAAVE